MELSELQALWQQQDTKLSENTRINKEILKQILVAKPEKRINREKIRVGGIDLILPFVIIPLVLFLLDIPFRASIDCYIGAFMFLGSFSLAYYWSVRYFMHLRKLDFSSSITSIKKEVNQLEKYKIKTTKFRYILMPFAMIGVFLVGDIPVFSKNFILPLSLIIIVFFMSIFVAFKYRIFEYHSKLNKEIAEVEKLEKEE